MSTPSSRSSRTSGRARHPARSSRTARATSPTPDPNLANNSGTATTIAAVMPQVGVHTTFPASVVAGAPFQYNVTVHNNGPVATSLELDDYSEYWMSFAGATGPGPCVVFESRLACTSPVLAVGATQTFTITGTTPPDLRPGSTVEHFANALILDNSLLDSSDGKATSTILPDVSI